MAFAVGLELRTSGDEPASYADAKAMIPSTAANEDLQKVLHKVGYPEVEEGDRPSNLLSKCITCIMKRIKKMEDLSTALNPPAEPKSLPLPDPKNERAASMAEQQRSSLIPRIPGLIGLLACCALVMREAVQV